MRQILRLWIVCILMPLVCSNSIGAEPAAAAAAEKPAKAAEAKEKNPNMRTWTSVSGAVIEAEYVESKFGKVVLRGSDGKDLVIPLHRLVPKDRAWVKDKAAVASGPVTVKKPEAENDLPVFSGGKWHNYHAAYVAKNFDAVIDKRGNVLIYPKDKGKRVGKPLSYGLRCYYYDTTINPPIHTGRPIAKLSFVPEPSVQPKQVTLCGLLKDLVSFNVTFEFSEKGVKSWGYCTDPADIRDKTYFRLGANVPASHAFTDEVSLAERAEILKGWRVVAEPVSGSRKEFAYADSIRGMGHRSGIVRIAAPVYGSRKLRFVTGDEDNAPLQPYIYSGYCPWQGYFVGMYKKTMGDRSSKLSFSLIVQ